MALLCGVIPGAGQALATQRNLAKQGRAATVAGHAARQRAQRPAAGSPGVPQPPTAVYAENFENNTGTAPVLLTNYVGAAPIGQRYTADPAYLTNCNGQVIEYNSPYAPLEANGCRYPPPPAPIDKNNLTAQQNVTAMAYALGVINGTPVPASNHAVTAYTQGANPGANKVQFATVTNIPLAQASRFLTFSVNAAEVNCTAAHAGFQFSLIGNSSSYPVTAAPIDPCTGSAIALPKSVVTSTAVRGGKFTADGSVLFSGSSFGIQMTNTQASGGGNDAAFDDIKVLDVTPSLDKSFSPATIPQGGTSVLTFTITNTSDLAAKTGWTFADTLPAGVVLASVPPATTCPGTNGNVGAPRASGTVSVTGSLSAGMTSCTVSVTVTSATAGTYTNDASNFSTLDGLNPPGSATLTVVPAVDLHVTKTEGPSPYTPGRPLSYTVTVSNTGPSDATGATVSDPLPPQLAGAGFTWTCTATAGSTCTAAGSGNITDTVTVAAGGTLTYTITGTVPSGADGTIDNTATATPPAGVSDPGCTPDCADTTSTPELNVVQLSVAKSSTPNPYVAGSPLSYTVTVSNAGPSDAVGTTVTDPLPAALGTGFTWTCTATAGSACTATGSGNISDTATIVAGGTLTYTITGTVPAGTTGTIIDTATVTPPPGAFDPGCTPDCQASNPNPTGPPVNMTVGKTAAPSPYVPGRPLTFTVTVANGGPGDALGALVRDPVPPQLTGAGFTWTCTATAGSSCTASGSGAIADTVNVLAGGTLTYTFTGTVPSSTGTMPSFAADIVNLATVTPPPANSDPGCTPNCSALVTVIPDVTVAMAVSKISVPAGSYVPGTPLTYTVTVSNAGPSDAVAASVDDPLPAALGNGFTWTCLPGTGSSCAGQGAGDIHDTVTIPAGSQVTYTVTGIVPPGATGTLSDTAAVTPPTGVTDPACTPDCSATAAATANVTVGLRVHKLSQPQPYVPGQVFTYMIAVTNAGPSDAVGVKVDDPLPPELAGAGFTWTCIATRGSSCTASGSGAIHDTVTVLSGGVVDYRVTGTIPASTTGTLVNTATATPPPGTTAPGCTPDCSGTAANPLDPTVALTVTKVAAPSPYVPGTTETFTITVSNAGPDDATGVGVIDQSYPQLTGITWTCAGTGGGTCTAAGTNPVNDTANIPAGASVVYTETGTIAPDAAGLLANIVQVTPPAGVLDPGCTPNCLGTAVVPGADKVDLTVAKTAVPARYVPGHTLTYTVTVTNGGPSDAVGARLSDPLPTALAGAGFTWTCKPGPGSSCTPSGTGSITDIVTIAAGSRVTYTITGTVPAGTRGPITETATVTPAPFSTDDGCTPSCAAVSRDTPAPTPTPRPKPKPPFVPVTG